MNHLDALLEILELVRMNNDTTEKPLTRYLPPARLEGQEIQGVSAVELGTQSIRYMREFMETRRLPNELCLKIMQK